MKNFLKKKIWLALAGFFIIGSIAGIAVIVVNFEYIPLAFARPYDKETGDGDNASGWAWNGMTGRCCLPGDWEQCDFSAGAECNKNIDCPKPGNPTYTECRAQAGMGWISLNSTDCDIDGDSVFEYDQEGNPPGSTPAPVDCPKYCDLNRNGIYGDDPGAPADCPTSGTFFPYGVRVETRDPDRLGILEGFAWSSWGWIAFEGLYTCDSNPTIVGTTLADCNALCAASAIPDTCTYDRPSDFGAGRGASCGDNTAPLSYTSCDRDGSDETGDGKRCTACYNYVDGYIRGSAKIIGMGDDGWLAFTGGGGGTYKGMVCGYATKNGAVETTVVDCFGRDVDHDGPGSCATMWDYKWSGWFPVNSGNYAAFCYEWDDNDIDQGTRCGMGNQISCGQDILGNDIYPNSGCPSGYVQGDAGNLKTCYRTTGGFVRGLLCGWHERHGGTDEIIVNCNGKDPSVECPSGYKQESFTLSGNQIETCAWKYKYPDYSLSNTWKIPEYGPAPDDYPDVWAGSTTGYAWNGARGRCNKPPYESCSNNRGCSDLDARCYPRVGLGWVNFWPNAPAEDRRVVLEVNRPPDRSSFVPIIDSGYYDWEEVCARDLELAPVIEWTFDDPDRGDRQTAYQILFDSIEHIPNGPGGINDEITLGFTDNAIDPISGTDDRLPLLTDKITGTESTFYLGNNSHRNIAKDVPRGIEYDTEYYAYMRIWDRGGVVSDWINVDSNGEIWKITTYEHEFPDASTTTWFPAFPDPPSEGEEARYFATSSAYYLAANPATPILCELDYSSNCDYWWKIAGSPDFEPFDDSSSTPIMQLNDMSDTYDITVNITDPDGYSCTSTPPLQFRPQHKLPTWKETKN